jgi:excisionase family DNA binding protein
MDKLLKAQEVADGLGVPLTTLYAWRSTGKGPRGFRVGKYVRFKASDVDAWLERQADPAPAA